jgi:hypothetical protein
MKFHEYEQQGKRRGAEIYDAHRALWSIGVYIHPDYRDDELATRKVVAYLAREMNITFVEFESELGGTPHLWPDRLAARSVITERLGRKALDGREDLVTDLMGQVRTHLVQTRSHDPDSWETLVGRYLGAAEGHPELGGG